MTHLFCRLVHSQIALAFFDGTGRCPFKSGDRLVEIDFINLTLIKKYWVAYQLPNLLREFLSR